MDLADTFTARQAARLSGLTLYMVNYLCREKLVEPTSRSDRGRGRRRAYAFADVVLLRALKRLLDSGISVSRLKRGLEELRRQHPDITPRTVPSRYLVTDGHRIYFRTKGDVLEALDGTGQFVFAFVVDFRQVRDEVLQEMEIGGLR